MKLSPVPLFFAVLATAANAQSDLAAMSLEDLSRMEVTTVSRKVQRLADTAAAVTVVTAEDIARSGARSIPEALRHVPGVQAAQIGPGQWAVSVRGFNGRFSNKLLVQVDGRTVYTPFFAGVFWEALPLPMEDVERIEVVRGPGASLWGSNAVNGVINIVTRRAATTLGGLAWFEIGDDGRKQAAVRQGFGSAEGMAGRVYARSVGRSELQNAGGEGLDNAQNGWTTGFRADMPTGARTAWSLQGDAYQLKSREQATFFSNPFGFNDSAALDFTYRGGNLMLSGNWPLANGEAELRTYLDHLSVNVLDEAKGIIDTVDADFQHRLDPIGRHELIWGLGARHIGYEFDGVPPILAFTRAKGNEHVFSGFVQDEITLQPKRWKLTLGTRVENHSLAGTEWQPNVRLLWTPTDRDSVWAHVSRASRTPSIGEQYASLIFTLAPVPPALAPPACSLAGVACTAAIVSRAAPGKDLQAEHLTAFELGLRRQIGAGSIEAVAYRHKFTDLEINQLGEMVAPGSLPFPVIADQFVNRVNGGEAHVVGLELSFDMPVGPGLRLGGSYTLQDLESKVVGNAGSAQAGNEQEAVLPHQMASLRASIDLGRRQDLDLLWRHVGALGASRFGPGIPSYQAVDANYRWRVVDGFDVALYVQNLFDERHAEFPSDFFAAPLGYVPRRVFLKGTVRF